ncbi:MAG: glycosyltransferase [Flavobacteriaceae bacterium]|nr:glycosyltransferase [Flavobacteriaceae bacterium]
MKKALIIQNKFIGDVLVSAIIAKNLKKFSPDTEIHFFCYDKAIGILKNNPYVDKIISFDDTELKKLPVLWKYAKGIRNEKYDILIDPYAKLQSRIITVISKAKQRISFNKPFFKYFYTDVYTEKKDFQIIRCTSIENRCLLLSPFIKDFKQIDFQTEIFLTDKEIEDAEKLMRDSGITFSKPIIVLGVLGSSMDKSWPLSYMADLVNVLLENYDVDVLFNYVPNQQKEVDILLENVIHRDKIITTVLGNNVREFAAILKNSDALIANEGGAINVAKALLKPTYSIFSPHKFRRDWGCYENLFIHQSFHLTDIFPEVYTQYSVKEILKEPKPFYTLMYPEKVIPKVENFIQKTLKIPVKTGISTKLNHNHPKITALCITYNEENNVERFFKDISFVDEIIVVDSFSTDKTKEIIKKYPNVRLLEREFDNFTNQKNFAIEQATYDWIVFFDLDEHVSGSLKAEIIMTINSPDVKDAYWVRRNFFFQDKPIRYSGWKNDKVIRLFRKTKSRYKKHKFVHEEIECDTQPGFLKNRLDHYSFNSVGSYQKKLNQYAHLKAKELFAKEVKSNFFHHYIKPLYRFFHHYIIQYGFMDGKEGLIISKMYAQYVSNRYKYLDKLWEEKEKPQP